MKFGNAYNFSHIISMGNMGAKPPGGLLASTAPSVPEEPIKPTLWKNMPLLKPPPKPVQFHKGEIAHDNFGHWTDGIHLDQTKIDKALSKDEIVKNEAREGRVYTTRTAFSPDEISFMQHISENEKAYKPGDGPCNFEFYLRAIDQYNLKNINDPKLVKAGVKDLGADKGGFYGYGRSDVTAAGNAAHKRRVLSGFTRPGDYGEPTGAQAEFLNTSDAIPIWNFFTRTTETIIEAAHGNAHAGKAAGMAAINTVDSGITIGTLGSGAAEEVGAKLAVREAAELAAKEAAEAAAKASESVAEHAGIVAAKTSAKEITQNTSKMVAKSVAKNAERAAARGEAVVSKASVQAEEKAAESVVKKKVTASVSKSLTTEGSESALTSANAASSAGAKQVAKRVAKRYVTGAAIGASVAEGISQITSGQNFWDANAEYDHYDAGATRVDAHNVPGDVHDHDTGGRVQPGNSRVRANGSYKERDTHNERERNQAEMSAREKDHSWHPNPDARVSSMDADMLYLVTGGTIVVAAAYYYMK